MLWITLALLLMVIQFTFILIREYCRPQKAVAWIVIVSIFPLIGFLVYLFVAQEYSCFAPTRRDENRKLAPLKKQLITRCKQRLALNPNGRNGDPDHGLYASLQNKDALPLTARNEITVYNEGEAAFQAMFESVALAKRHIHIEFYIIRDDVLGKRFRELLIRKAREGVKVRLLFDGVGSWRLKKSYLKPLRDAGVEIGCYGPPLSSFLDKQVNYRNHRKIVVVDGKVGFIGGLNIGDEYLGKNVEIGYWRDTHFKLEGDAVLWIQYAFAEDWLYVKRQLLMDAWYYPIPSAQGNDFVQIVKSGPDETIVEFIFTFIVSAKKRIFIETPYFVPDPGVLLALKTAARRGVDVRVIIPAVPDTKLVFWASLSYVKEMIEAGVRFYLYHKGFIHAKVIISDDFACSGSANMDMRSFTGQFELNAVFIDGSIVSRLSEQFFHDLHDCEEIVLTEFDKRDRLQKVKEGFARLLSPLF